MERVYCTDFYNAVQQIDKRLGHTAVRNSSPWKSDQPAPMEAGTSEVVTGAEDQDGEEVQFLRYLKSNCEHRRPAAPDRDRSPLLRR